MYPWDLFFFFLWPLIYPTSSPTWLLCLFNAFSSTFLLNPFLSLTLYILTLFFFLQNLPSFFSLFTSFGNRLREMIRLFLVGFGICLCLVFVIRTGYWCGSIRRQCPKEFVGFCFLIEPCQYHVLNFFLYCMFILFMYPSALKVRSF